MPEGRQSPPPEQQSGAQKDAPSKGQGVNPESNNQNQSKKDLEVSRLVSCLCSYFTLSLKLQQPPPLLEEQLKTGLWKADYNRRLMGKIHADKGQIQNLSSNPTAPLDKHAGDVVSKTLDNATENSKA